MLHCQQESPYMLDSMQVASSAKAHGHTSKFHIGCYGCKVDLLLGVRLSVVCHGQVPSLEVYVSNMKGTILLLDLLHLLGAWTKLLKVRPLHCAVCMENKSLQC